MLQSYFGSIDYKVGQQGLVNTTINGFSNKTGYGMTAIVSLSKSISSYQFNWNVQVNYLAPLTQNMYSQIWFSPNFALNNPQNTTGNFTWLNYICEQSFWTDFDNTTVEEPYYETKLYSGPADLNMPSEDFYSTYENAEEQDVWNDYLPFSSTWFVVNQQIALNGTNATNKSAATPPVYSSGCQGSRLVGKGVDAGYRDLLLNTNVAYRAGFKFWNNTQILAQSWATPFAFNFTLTDTALFANNTTPQPVVADAWTAYFPLLNATKGNPCFNESNPCPANPTSNVTQNATKNATFFYQKAAPKYYVVQNFSLITGYGHGVAITLVKYQSGYGLVWNSQTNTNKPVVNGTIYQSWFSPVWGANNTVYHYVCMNDRTVAVTNVTNSSGAVINSTAAITNNWTNSIGSVNYTLNFLTVYQQNNFWNNEDMQFNDTWMQGINQSNVSDSTKNFTQGCMGARPLYFNDTRLQTIKYNDTIQFAAGFALFQRNATSEWDENWAVTQSWSNAPFFSYKVADTVVKDGVDSCDLLDEEGNCLAAEFTEEETTATDSIESTFDEGLQNTGSFRL